MHFENSPQYKIVQSKFPTEVKENERFIDSFHCALTKGAILL
jgi:hypothetical protein